MILGKYYIYNIIWGKLNHQISMLYHLYSMCDDNMDIITVLKYMIDVRDGFKACAYYTNNDVEDVINDICLSWNVKLTVFNFLIVSLFLLQCVNKDIIIITFHGNNAMFSGSLALQYWIMTALLLNKPTYCWSMPFTQHYNQTNRWVIYNSTYLEDKCLIENWVKVLLNNCSFLYFRGLGCHIDFNEWVWCARFIHTRHVCSLNHSYQ